MKFLIIATLAVLASADVSHLKPSERDAKILKLELDSGVEGQYQWALETDNGISASEQGALKNPESENAAEVVQGQAKWTSPEGEVISLQYVADENGYQPQGSHLPTPPPIPPAIIKALEYIRAHPPPVESSN